MDINHLARARSSTYYTVNSVRMRSVCRMASTVALFKHASKHNNEHTLYPARRPGLLRVTVSGIFKLLGRFSPRKLERENQSVHIFIANANPTSAVKKKNWREGRGCANPRYTFSGGSYLKITRAFHGSGRVGVTRPDSRQIKASGPDPTRPDPTRPDPTRPDPTRPEPTRPVS